MKVEVFQSEKGDCLLVTGKDGRRILVDGGMKASYSRFVAPALGRLQEQGGLLDLVCVTHIDEDHIAGVLQMLDDLVAWRVHSYHLQHGYPGHKEPVTPRPPEVRAIWHNAFHEQVGANAGSISDLLAATATVLSAKWDEAKIGKLARERRDLATSTKEAIKLSRRIGAGQLKIPLNADFDGRLATVREGLPEVRLGEMKLYVIGPFEADLERLRKEWNDWLNENKKALEDIARKAKRDEALLKADEVARLVTPQLIQAEELGRREKVTVPNLASLMLLVEEDDKTLLLTGDGHAADILRGLDHWGRLDRSGHIHVDVLKVQHHGSEHNADDEFWGAVTADHYVFCGNGEHDNPDLRVLEGLVRSRVGSEDQRPFNLWFSSSPQMVEGNDERSEAARGHLLEVERRVTRLADECGGRLSFTFSGSPSVEIAV